MDEQTLMTQGEFRFNNCAYRSDDEDTKEIKTCSCPQTTTVKGHHCSFHGVFPLDLKFCGVCNEFIQKEKELDGQD